MHKILFFCLIFTATSFALIASAAGVIASHAGVDAGADEATHACRAMIYHVDAGAGAPSADIIRAEDPFLKLAELHSPRGEFWGHDLWNLIVSNETLKEASCIAMPNRYDSMVERSIAKYIKAGYVTLDSEAPTPENLEERYPKLWEEIRENVKILGGIIATRVDPCRVAAMGGSPDTNQWIMKDACWVPVNKIATLNEEEARMYAAIRKDTTTVVGVCLNALYAVPSVISWIRGGALALDADTAGAADTSPIEDPFTKRYVGVMEKRKDFNRLAAMGLTILETSPRLRGIIFRESYLYYLLEMVEMRQTCISELQRGENSFLGDITAFPGERPWRPHMPWPLASTEERWKQGEIARLQSEIEKYRQEIAELDVDNDRQKEVPLAARAADVSVASAAAGSGSVSSAAVIPSVSSSPIQSV